MWSQSCQSIEIISPDYDKAGLGEHSYNILVSATGICMTNSLFHLGDWSVHNLDAYALLAQGIHQFARLPEFFYATFPWNHTNVI